MLNRRHRILREQVCSRLRHANRIRNLHSAIPTPCGRSRREASSGKSAAASPRWRSSICSAATASSARPHRRRTPRQVTAKLQPHFPAKAKHCIFLFMNGAPSQVDTFDPKPALAKHDGQPYQGNVKVGSNNRPVGYLMQSPFQFQTARPKRPGDQRPLSAHGAARRRSVRAALDVHRHGRPLLRLPAAEHRQPAHRQAEPRLLAELRPGLAEREPAQLRRDDRPARRADRQRVELERGLHAGPLSGNALPQRRIAAARPGDARRRQPRDPAPARSTCCKT